MLRTILTTNRFRIGWGNLFRAGRTAADINQGKPLEEMTIIEGLGRTKLEDDSHDSCRATDMPRAFNPVNGIHRTWRNPRDCSRRARSIWCRNSFSTVTASVLAAVFFARCIVRSIFVSWAGTSMRMPDRIAQSRGHPAPILRNGRGEHGHRHALQTLALIPTRFSRSLSDKSSWAVKWSASGRLQQVEALRLLWAYGVSEAELADAVEHVCLNIRPVRQQPRNIG